jgi:uracil phosphoribosyltransferase
VLRDEKTDSPTFRRLVEELVTLLAYEATRDVQTVSVTIKTPVTETTGLEDGRTSSSCSSYSSCGSWNA